MTRRRTFKNKKSLRRKSRRDRRKSGGGYGDLPVGSFDKIAINPGNQVHFPYTGPGKDCTGDPGSTGRPGYIFNYSDKGLPGFSGGKRRNRKYNGGAAMPYVAGAFPVTNPNLAPVSGSLTQKPLDFPDTTGAGGSVGQPVVMSMPGVPTPGAAQMPVVELSKSADATNLAAPQKGGRYGFFPGMGPLNPTNGVGISPAPFGRIPCEGGTYNPLNPNPGDIQRMTTAPLTPPYVTGRFMGGASPVAATAAAVVSSASGFSAANFPMVQVGQADSMRYYAPTAGYKNDFMTFPAPSAVPGLTIQTPYDAKAFNQACIKTGGSRKNKNRRGGAGPVAFDAGKFTPVTIGEIGTRMDFDGTNKGLPVKFGGKRRTRRVLKNKRRSCKNRRN